MAQCRILSYQIAGLCKMVDQNREKQAWEMYSHLELIWHTFSSLDNDDVVASIIPILSSWVVRF